MSFSGTHVFQSLNLGELVRSANRQNSSWSFEHKPIFTRDLEKSVKEKARLEFSKRVLFAIDTKHFGT